ncbi:MAG TPA: methyltransferase domain-containing protein [Thermoanaerobaculia bacterium]|nr:methyltransferase domain-containing protein [Thermoanaerobaculia bacterium]
MANVYTFKDFEGSSHRILIDLIRRYARKGGTLIDLGAAGGELGAAVRDQFERTIGFEYNGDCIADLREHFDAAVISDLEKVKHLPHGADAIVAADVIEHLRDASSLLALIHHALAPQGRLFISVPNIANITVRLGLLFGIFEYRDRGILDNTHLRFYTLRTIRREVEAAGFRVVAMRGSSVPLRLIVGRFTPEFLLRIGERVLSMVTRVWRSLFAYQIILVAERQKAEGRTQK